MTASPLKPDLQPPAHPPRHFSFLLRCMETCCQMPAQPLTDSNWRFSLQDPKSETIHNFRDFEALVAFLKCILDDSQAIPKTDQGNNKNAT